MSYTDALKLCEGIISDLEELHEQYERWRENKYELVEDVQIWIEKNKLCTTKQAKMLLNIRDEVTERMD